MDQLPSALLHQRASVIRWLDGRMRGCNIKGLTKPVSGGKEARNVSPVTLKLTMFIWSWPVWHLAYYQCPCGWCFNCQSPSAVPLGRKTWRLSAMLFQGRANVSIALVFLLALLHPNIFKNSTCKHLHFFNEHGLGYVRIKISKFLVFLAERKQRFCLNCISGGATNQQFHNDCNCVWQNASPKIKSAKCSRTYCIENETSCYALAAILVDGLLLASQHILNLKRDLFLKLVPLFFLLVLVSPTTTLSHPGKESQRPVAHECLGEVLRILRQVINTYPLLNTVEILTAAGKLISKVKGRQTLLFFLDACLWKSRCKSELYNDGKTQHHSVTTLDHDWNLNTCTIFQVSTMSPLTRLIKRTLRRQLKPLLSLLVASKYLNQLFIHI